MSKFSTTKKLKKFFQSKVIFKQFSKSINATKKKIIRNFVSSSINTNVRDLVENVIVLTKISNMQINYIHETRFKYALRCSSRRIYDFLFEICFFEMMRSHYFFFKFHELLRMSFVFYFFLHDFLNDFQLFLFIEFFLNCLSRSRFLQHCSWNINNSNEFINSTLIFWNCSIFLSTHACSKTFVDA